MPGSGEGRGGTAAWTRYRVQVNVVRHLVVLVVVQMKLDLVVLPDPNKSPRYSTTEGPKDIIYAVGKPLDDLANFQMHNDLRRSFSRDWRRHVGCWREHCGFLTLNMRVSRLHAPRQHRF